MSLVNVYKVFYLDGKGREKVCFAEKPSEDELIHYLNNNNINYIDYFIEETKTIDDRT